MTTGLLMVILGIAGIIIFGIALIVSITGLGRKRRKMIRKIQEE